MRFYCIPLLAVAILIPGGRAIAGNNPAIAIIIDDLGNNPTVGERAVTLPAKITCAFLPHTPYAAALARQAHKAGKEVLLHLPLEAVHHQKLGPGGLTLHMTKSEFVATVRDDLAAIPDVDGVNNHMGSLLTQHPGDMGWLMSVLAKSPSLFFVDSRTTARTVAYEVAREKGVPATWRDVFLDDERDAAAIVEQLHRLVNIARRRGTAIAIGHPYPVTLEVLRKQLPRLERQGIDVVGIREVIARQAGQTPPSKVTSISSAAN